MSKIEDALKSLNKQFGQGSVYELGDFKPEPLERIDSGSIGINSITGGGYPVGKITEIFGGESSGKTTLSLLAVRECQRAGKKALYVDAEHALDLEYASLLGVNTDDMLLSQPDNMEEGYQIIDTLVRTGEIGLVIFDSIAQSQTKKEQEGDIGDQSMGLKARLMSTTMPKFSTLFNQTDTCGIWLNQIREKIGVMFGSPITTPGGRAMKFTASVRIELSKLAPKDDDKAGEDVLSNTVKAKCIKNKTAPPFKRCEYKIVFGEGIDNMRELIDLAVAKDIINKSGSWYSYGDVKLGQGSKGVKSILSDNPELYEEIKSQL